MLARAKVGGKQITASKRTISHLRWTVWRLRARHPLARLVVVQGPYNTTVKASKGTHDGDAVLDVYIKGLSWPKSQAFLRQCGWAAWWRHTGQWAPVGNWHIHMVSIPPGLSPNPTAPEVHAAYIRLGTRVGEFVPGQVDDYYAHALGLAGQHRAGSDPTWHPANINKTVFKQTKGLK